MPNPIRILRSVVPTARPTARQSGEPYINFADRQLGVFSAQAMDLLAVRYWAITATYAAGDCVLNVVGGGALWVAKQAISPGMFDPQLWDQIGGGASVTIGDVAPTSPVAGDLWWDSESGQMFIRYQDQDSSQWVAT